MTRQEVTDKLLNTFRRYGVTLSIINHVIDNLEGNGFSYKKIYTKIRMLFGITYEVCEDFSVEDIDIIEI